MSGSSENTQTVTRQDLAEAVYREIGLSRTESSALVESVIDHIGNALEKGCLLYTSPSPRDATLSRMPSSA